MLIRAYLFAYNIFENLIAFVRSIQFLTTLNKLRVFQRRNPEDVLRVLRIFICLEAPYYRDTVKMNRNMAASVNLLSVLINTYLRRHSDTHLEQLLEVLKNEFIKRERE